MQLPEKPPLNVGYSNISGEDFVRFLRDEDGLVKNLIKKISQDDYLYWDKVKHYADPSKKLSAEILWTFVKNNRALTAKTLPLIDLKGQPFTYNTPEKINMTIHEIDRGNPRQIGANLPFDGNDYPRFIMDSIMEEAIASSQLEGAATTREVAKEMLRTGRKPTDVSERMILNNYRTMQEIKKVKDEPLSRELIIHLHTHLTDQTLDDQETVGRFRTKDEPVGVYDITDNTELYIAPESELLEGRISKLIEFANTRHDTPENFIHPVIKAILLHFWIGYEHPFVDGNGRTARALFYWFMLKNKYWLFEFLSISRIFNQSPMRYMRAFLFTEFDENDLTYFISFNVESISRALSQLGEYIEKKQAEKQTSLSLLKSIGGINERQYVILSEALQKPGRTFTIESHRSNNNIVYETARKDFLQLMERGYLVAVKRGKKFIFTSADDLKEKLSSAT